MLAALALLAGVAALRSAHAADGAFEISASRIPMTITNAGSYVLTEDISAVNGELIAAGSVWKYLDDGSNLGAGWTTNGFDDSAWRSGPALLGYGYLNVVTTNSFGPNPSSKYITTYFRSTFEVENKSKFTHMDLFVRRDDGIVVYLNGNEVLRDNMPAGPITYTTLAATSVPNGNHTNGDPRDTYFEFFVSPTNLVNGTNVLAAEVHQVTANSTDMLFDLGLNAYTNGTGDPTNAITITVSGVSLDLRGHVLRGTELSSKNGIEVLPDARGTIIQNGTVTRWGNAGIAGELATNTVVRNIRAIRNFRDGILVGPASTIANCMAGQNGRTVQAFEKGDGVIADEGSVFMRNTSYDNFDHGFLAHSSAVLTDCVTSQNSHDGIHGGPGLVVARCIAANTQLNAAGRRGEGIEIQTGSAVKDSISLACDDGIKARNDASDNVVYYRCTSISNWADGIKSGVGSLFIRCNAINNREKGITANGQSLMIYNMAERNGLVGKPSGGIHLKGNGNFVAFNHLVGNCYGIASNTSLNNLIIGNSASYSLRTNALLNAGNLTGFFTTDGNSPRAGINFRLGN